MFGLRMADIETTGVRQGRFSGSGSTVNLPFFFKGCFAKPWIFQMKKLK